MSGPRLGVSTAAFFPRPLEDVLRILDQQPWKYIELMPQAPAECRPEFAGQIQEISAGRFDFCAIHFPLILQPFLFNPYPAAREFGQGLCAGLGRLAGALGCSVIVVHGPWERMSTGAFLEVTQANLRLLCDTCAGDGVMVALENTTSSPFGESPEAMVAFVEDIDRPNLSFALDITHAHQMNQDPLAYIRHLPELVHVHASDFAVAGGKRHLPPGEGIVDWPAIMDALCGKGFAGNFVIELLPETLGDHPVQTLQRSTAMLTPLFEDWPTTS